MEEFRKDVSPAKTALKWGLIGGAVTILISLLFYLIDYEDQSVSFLVNLLILIGAVVMAMKEHRDEDLGGYLEYSRGLGTGVLTSLFLGILVAIYMVIYMEIIDPSILEEAMAEMERQFAEEEMSADEREQAMKVGQFFVTPAFVGISTVFLDVLLGLIVSLIGSAFMQRS